MKCRATVCATRGLAPVPGRLAAVLSVLAAAAVLMPPGLAACWAVTPESPEVQQLVAKGIQFLEQPLPPDHLFAKYNTPPGAKALTGLCMLKYYKGKDASDGKNHPRVHEAVAAIRGTISKNTSGLVTMDVYSTGVSLIFLLELDPLAHHDDIEKLTNHLVTLQKSHGGWGYPEKPTGDTSQTQYGVLGLWAAQQAGIGAPLDSWERATNWLMRTQDPSGAHGYQGNDPGNFELVRQPEVRLSLATAGLGSLYICADQLAANNAQDGIGELPGKLKPVGKNSEGKRLHKVSETRLAEAQRRGDAYLQANFTLQPDQWAHYYLYALERYYSFKDFVPGRKGGNEPWYNEGFRVLSETQNADGSWQSPPESHIVADTSFAILFLLRSTQTIIERAKAFGGGTLTGGRGLPESGDIQMRLGSVVTKPLAGPAEDVLLKMKDPDGPEFQAAVAALEKLSAEGQQELLSEHAQRLRELAGGDSPEARAAALVALSRTRNLDEVPILLEALQDPDGRVFRAAYEGLRFISRRNLGGGPPERLTRVERITAIEEWESWYRSIRPLARAQE